MRGVHNRIFLNRFINTVHIEDYFCLQTSVADCARSTFHGVQDGFNLLDDPWYRLLGPRWSVIETIRNIEHIN